MLQFKTLFPVTPGLFPKPYQSLHVPTHPHGLRTPQKPYSTLSTVAQYVPFPVNHPSPRNIPEQKCYSYNSCSSFSWPTSTYSTGALLSLRTAPTPASAAHYGASAVITCLYGCSPAGSQKARTHSLLYLPSLALCRTHVWYVVNNYLMNGYNSKNGYWD